MSLSRTSLAGARVLDLRTPLARVELAASQLEREAVSPSGRELARRIREAVDEIATRIDDVLPLLFAAPTDPVDERDVAGVLDELHARLSASLAARGIVWERGEAPERSPRDEPHRVRRSALALLRAGVASVGTGGRLRLALATEAHRYALCLELRAAGGRVPTPAEAVLASLEELAVRHDGQLEQLDSQKGFAARLWLAKTDACPAS